MTIKEEYSGILAKYNTTFQVTRAATTYFPEPEDGWETIINCKKEGWIVETQLLVDIEDPEILEKMKKEATKLGITVDEMMIILKKNEITMENCTATISIASDINKNTDIQEIANKMKSILGGEVKSHSLLLNTKPISASHANYGRGKIEEKYDVVTAKYRPGMVRVE